MIYQILLRISQRAYSHIVAKEERTLEERMRGDLEGDLRFLKGFLHRWPAYHPRPSIIPREPPSVTAARNLRACYEGRVLLRELEK